MLYFIDCEFIERPNTIELISIGIKCEDGRSYYALSKEYDFNNASEWVFKNVILPLYDEIEPLKHIGVNLSNFHKYYGKGISEIKHEILNFLKYPFLCGSEPEFWGWYSAYDWVAFCWIFGKMIDLPEGFPMHCNDLKQLQNFTGGKRLPQPEGVHNALVDAKWNEEMYNHLMKGLGDL